MTPHTACLRTLLLAGLLACAVPSAQAAQPGMVNIGPMQETIAVAKLDLANRVVLRFSTGKSIRMPASIIGQPNQLQRAPNGMAAAWLLEGREGAQDLVIYYSGQTHILHCEPYIRTFWFWNQGLQLGMDCGGSHLAGQEILYDTATRAEIARFDQADVAPENRPEWSYSRVKAAY